MGVAWLLALSLVGVLVGLVLKPYDRQLKHSLSVGRDREALNEKIPYTIPAVYLGIIVLEIAWWHLFVNATDVEALPPIASVFAVVTGTPFITFVQLAHFIYQSRRRSKPRLHR